MEATLIVSPHHFEMFYYRFVVSYDAYFSEKTVVVEMLLPHVVFLVFQSHG